MTTTPRPEDPSDAGVPEKVPAQSTAIEAARVLANDTKARLEPAGFDDEQLRRWAETYITDHGSGDVDGFIAWIQAMEDGGA